MGSNGSRESPQLLQGVPEAVSKPSARSPWVNTALQPALLGKTASSGVPWGETLRDSSVGRVGAGGKERWGVREEGAALPRSPWGSGAEPWLRRSLLVTHRGDTAVGSPCWARPAIYGSRGSTAAGLGAEQRREQSREPGVRRLLWLSLGCAPRACHARPGHGAGMGRVRRSRAPLERLPCSWHSWGSGDVTPSPGDTGSGCHLRALCELALPRGGGHGLAPLTAPAQACGPD